MFLVISNYVRIKDNDDPNQLPSVMNVEVCKTELDAQLKLQSYTMGVLKDSVDVDEFWRMYKDQYKESVHWKCGHPWKHFIYDDCELWMNTGRTIVKTKDQICTFTATFESEW